jgi:hypothetical protein
MALVINVWNICSVRTVWFIDVPKCREERIELPYASLYEDDESIEALEPRRFSMLLKFASNGNKIRFISTF